MKVIVVVFNIFYLLLDVVRYFKEWVVDNVFDLEEKLRWIYFSFFCVLFYCYFNKYVMDVWVMFIGKLDELKYGWFMFQVF